MGTKEHSRALIDLSYEVALDNSRWPDLIQELSSELSRELISPDHLDAQDRADCVAEADENASRIDEILAQLRFTARLSERVCKLQTSLGQLSAILDAISFGVAVWSEQGDLIGANQYVEDAFLGANKELERDTQLRSKDEPEENRSIKRWIETCNIKGRSITLDFGRETELSILVMPFGEAEKFGLYYSGSGAVMIVTNRNKPEAVSVFAKANKLTVSEARLLESLIAMSNLKEAAEAAGLTYESGRTYLKRIYSKTGTGNQGELVRNVLSSPLAMLNWGEEQSVSASWNREGLVRDGIRVEWFSFGPKNGRPVFIVYGLTDSSIDLLNGREVTEKLLREANVRLVFPVWPGTYQAEAREHYDAAAFVSDIERIATHLGFETFSIFATGIAATTALRVAHDFPDRVSRVVLASAFCPDFRQKRVLNSQGFYALTVTLRQNWPSVFRVTAKAILRSIASRPAQYLKKEEAPAKTLHESRIINDNSKRLRNIKMIKLKSVQGVDGWVGQLFSYLAPYDFELEDISTSVEIYQGEFDTIHPFEGAEMIAKRLPRCELHMLEDQEHSHPVVNWPWMVKRATGDECATGEILAPIDPSDSMAGIDA